MVITYLLDISQSSYIFLQKVTISIIVALITVALILFFLFRIFRAKGEVRQQYRITYNNAFFILSTVIVYLIIFLPQFQDALNLKRHGVETEGRTLKWVNIGDGQFDIEYSFKVGNMTFIKQCGIVYGGKVIESIICPNGQYVVIYDKENPENSVMDLKRPIKRNIGQHKFSATAASGY